MHDPDFDPSGWALKAVVAYLQAYPAEGLEDPLTRKYLFRGMETSDVSNFLRKIESDQHELTAELINAFIDQAARLHSSYSFDDCARGILRRIRLLPSTYHHTLVTRLVNCSYMRHGQLMMNYLPVFDRQIALAAYDNWCGVHHTPDDWELWMRTIFVDDLVERIFSNGSTPLLNRWISAGSSMGMDRVIHLINQVTDLLPVERLKDWEEHIQKPDYSIPISRQNRTTKSKQSAYLSITTCACGFNSKSPSAATMHIKRSGDGACEEDNPVVRIRKRRGREDLKSLICPDCGIRDFSNVPSLDMHRKYCGKTK
jgi:hypothetical protein